MEIELIKNSARIRFESWKHCYNNKLIFDPIKIRFLGQDEYEELVEKEFKKLQQDYLNIPI